MSRARALEKELEGALHLVEGSRAAHIYFHRDADGLCGAAIMTHLLRARGIPVSLSAHLASDMRTVQPPEDLSVFVDIGSGQLDDLSPRFRSGRVLILDHHPRQGGTWSGLTHLNPYDFGLDGSKDVSGSGLAFLLERKALGNGEMSKVALVGAVADRQDLMGRLEGINAQILKEGAKAGLVAEEKDVLLFGRESRPLHIALKSFQDPPIPGVSGHEPGSIRLLADLGIPLKDQGGFRTLQDLTEDERRRLASELVIRCLPKVSPEIAALIPKMIIGSVYRMIGEDAPLQYASEYATCVNSAARMGLVEEALSVLLGDRGKAYRKVLGGLNEYRRRLSKEIRRVDEVKVSRKGYLQYFLAEGTPMELIGPVTGLVLGGGLADPYRPLVGLARGDIVKASARCSKILVLEGIDLSSAAEDAARSVGGEGGGHRGAAGGFFEPGREGDFLSRFETHLLRSLGSKKSR